MKKRQLGIVAALLIAVVAALSLSMFILNRTDDKVQVKLGKPEQPTVNCIVSGKSVNTLFGYKDTMNIPFVRDTITPVSNSGKLAVEVDHASESDYTLTYEVFTLDGNTSLGKGTGSLKGENYELDLKDALSKLKDEKEAVLMITLSDEEDEIHYYTRVISDSELNIDGCLNFVQQFNEDTFNPARKEDVAQYLEPVWDRPNDNFRHVDVNSNVYHVMWGNMEPEVISDISWSIKESNTVYSSFTAEYQVKITDDKENEEYFTVKEYYRVRFLKDKNYLLNFDRTMEQIFDPSGNVLTEDGLILGIVPPSIEYKGSDNGNFVAFVQADNLWLYDIEKHKASSVFGFADLGDLDNRNLNNSHDIHIVNIDNSGNITFLVRGYMNRGIHEGTTGISVSYFNYDEYEVKEKAFMPGNKSGDIMISEAGRMIYYSAARETIGYIKDNSLLEAKEDAKEPKVIIEEIPDGHYIVSDDGHLIGCRTEDGDKIYVYDFNDGSEYEIPAKEGETIKPLGFLKDDIIYGRSTLKGTVKMESGEEVDPLDCIEIMDSTGEVIKHYSSEGRIITGVTIDENLITVNRAVKDNDVYKADKEDYISNNEDDKSKAVQVEMFTTELQEKQFFIEFESEKPEKSVSAGYPEIILSDNIIEVGDEDASDEKEYYVYAKGLPPQKYKSAADAIQNADKTAGIVVDENQKYIWEKGNRNLSYYNDTPSFTTGVKETALEACERALSGFDGTQVRLTGCTLNQVYYVIGKGTPAITKMDSDKYVLITGYNLDNVEYISPEDGNTYYEPVKSMEDKIKDNGNFFIVNL